MIEYSYIMIRTLYIGRITKFLAAVMEELKYTINGGSESMQMDPPEPRAPLPTPLR